MQEPKPTRQLLHGICASGDKSFPSCVMKIHGDGDVVHLPDPQAHLKNKPQKHFFPHSSKAS